MLCCRMKLLLLLALCGTALTAQTGRRQGRQDAGPVDGADLDTLIKDVFTPAPPGQPRTDERDNLDNGGGDPLNCQCVPYYLCQNGTIKTDGEGVIDIR